MRLAIVTLAKMPAVMGKFYNAQDVGLGIALAKRLAVMSGGGTDGEPDLVEASREVSQEASRELSGEVSLELSVYVDVYNFVEDLSSTDDGTGCGCTSAFGDVPGETVTDLGDGVLLHRMACRFFGVHSLCRDDFLPETCDGVIVFSDNQINFKHVRRLCKKRGIPCLPYIGVVGSNNGNPVKSVIMNMLANNVKYYRTMKVLAKTPKVADELKRRGACNVTVAPVCLNEGMLKKDYISCDRARLRKQLGLAGFVILYVGRLCREKQPLAMLEIYERLLGTGVSASLVMIGRGELAEQVRQGIAIIEKEYAQTSIKLVDRVENDRMWEYYVSCDCMVNLNDHEIFGMSILEAMYYELPVVAVKAPGPEFIMQGEAGHSGVICDDKIQVLQAVEGLANGGVLVDVRGAHDHIARSFLWEKTADIILGEIV